MMRGPHEIISRAACGTFLGITVNENLSWKTHMEGLLQKFRRNLGVIVKIKPYLGTSNLISLYHTMFESKLRYCISVWKHGQEGLVKKLQKICDKLGNMTTKSSGCISKTLLSVDKLFEMETSRFMYRVNKHLLPDCFSGPPPWRKR